MDLNYFVPGQLWQYDTRAAESESTLTILKIDDWEEEVIVHVRIDKLRINGGLGYISHLAFSADVLLESLVAFIGHLESVPEYEDDYQQWKRGFDFGKIKYITIPVKEAIAAIEKTAGI